MADLFGADDPWANLKVYSRKARPSFFSAPDTNLPRDWPPRATSASAPSNPHSAPISSTLPPFLTYGVPGYLAAGGLGAVQGVLVGWCSWAMIMASFAAFGGILFAYDTGTIGGIIAMDDWLKVFGTYDGTHTLGLATNGYYLPGRGAEVEAEACGSTARCQSRVRGRR
ncbi:hypothetical protein FIBSPDRAFT_958568 [Athelia psychrophila]|uniref:Uncharacterized protein n=1 Tax=Athelia psychrophila TaxID=1759441 RepID=A0A166EG19_9AGAM|nr:hypothetical protein FIBSPDRAFT_958568 [Fibularhizoctonia sp. CBS 109695]